MTATNDQCLYSCSDCPWWGVYHAPTSDESECGYEKSDHYGQRLSYKYPQCDAWIEERQHAKAGEYYKVPGVVYVS